MTSIVFGEKLEYIGDYAFTHCSGIGELHLPRSLKYIGKYAFVGCSSLTAVQLPESLESIGGYAFASLRGVTFYTAAGKADCGWGAVWNASYRPVFWDCEFSEDGYLVSFVKSEDTIGNFNSAAEFSAPKREGYAFVGWATTPSATEAVFTLEQTADVQNGTTLYAVWEKIS